MQIKKFEARTMKEALEMVKSQLGPDAVILSAKEINKGFGLGGSKSIEITAAYSEKVLQNKKYVESKMPDYLKDQFLKTSAKKQKETIQLAYTKLLAENNSRNSIKSETEPRIRALGSNQSMNLNPSQRRYIEIDEHEVIRPVEKSMMLTQQAQNKFNNLEVDQLKNEIEQLKNLVSQFKNIPQNFIQGHPGAEFGVNYNLSGFFQKLTSRGLSSEVAAEILVQAQSQITAEKLNNKNIVEAYIARFILKATTLSSENHEQFHLFVGPSGSGKTTAMIKYASELMLHYGKKVALVSTDTQKIGAHEQMLIYSRILNLPFIAIHSQNDWHKMTPYLHEVDHILVDYSSLNMKSPDEVLFFNKMRPPVYDSIKTHLVLSTLSKDQDLFDIYKRYQNIQVSDVIFTFLDEASVHGNIYNFNRKTKLPLFAFGIGSRTPEDFERASTERVLDLILDITKSKEPLLDSKFFNSTNQNEQEKI